MIYVLRTSLGLAVLFCALLCLIAPGIAPASSGAPLVVIDPGHGGMDPGAVDKVNGLLEKTINLDVGRRLARLLEAQGFRVLMTRQDDDLICQAGGTGFIRQNLGVRERVAIANRLKADLFISLHTNSFWDRRCAGAEIYYCPDSREGECLAGHFRIALDSSPASVNCKVRPGDYYVLRQTAMPAVVVEMGYLSNPREARLLSQPNYQEHLAQTLAQAVNAYFTGLRKARPA